MEKNSPEKFERPWGHCSFRIGVRQTHRLSAGKTGITIIEVQLGSNCSEDDIVRLKDDYQRV